LAVFTVTNVNDSGAGSLRQAILDANSTVAKDDIVFAMAGSVTHLIAAQTPLPTVTGAVTVDGFTQAGSRANTAGPGQANNAVSNIVLDGSAVLRYNHT